jgi:hypothetical protein
LPACEEIADKAASCAVVAPANSSFGSRRISTARLLELRAATDQARLRREVGSDDDSSALLEPIATIEGGETTPEDR